MIASTINGIDVLFVAIGLILLLAVAEIWGRYANWSDWDRDRRRQRKYDRYELQDYLAEKQYRTNLRRIAIIFQMTCSISKFTEAMNKTSQSFQKLNEALQGKIS